MSDTKVDLIGKDGAQGEVASQFLSAGSLNVNRMRPFVGKDGRSYISVCKGDPKKLESYESVPIQTNATLRRDEWKQLDEAVLRAARIRLGGVDDLVSRGLTYNLGDGMATTVLEYHDVSDSFEASLTMDGINRSQGDRPVFTTNYMPLPIIHVDFEINARVLAASRKLGNPLDTTSVEQATRRVLEKRESMLFTAASTAYTFGGGTIYGYLDQPSRNQVTLSANWDASAKTGAQILDDVLGMKQASINDRYFGPWMLYIPTAYERVLDEDYSTSYAKSIRTRILETDGIEDIKVVDTLTANNVILVQMTSDVVRLVQGMGIQVIEWANEGGMVTKYKVLTIQVPQCRADANSRSGIVHLAA